MRNRLVAIAALAIALTTASCGAGDPTEVITSAETQPTKTETASAEITEESLVIINSTKCQEVDPADVDHVKQLNSLAIQLGYSGTLDVEVVKEYCSANPETSISEAIHYDLSRRELSDKTTCDAFLKLEEGSRAGFIESVTYGKKYDLAKLPSLCEDPEAYLLDVIEGARIHPKFDENSTCKDFTNADIELRREALRELISFSEEVSDYDLDEKCGFTPDENLIAVTKKLIPLSWLYTDASGFTATVHPSIGSVIPKPSSAELKYRYSGEEDEYTMTVGEICSVDDQRDAVFEITAEMINTTDGYDLGLGWSVELKYISAADSGERYSPKTSLAPDERFKFVKVYSDGETSCESAMSGDFSYYGSAGYGVHYREVTAPNESNRDRLYLLIKDYYGPAAPDGDVDLLSVYGLMPRSYTTVQEQTMLPQDNPPVLLLNGDKFEQ